MSREAKLNELRRLQKLDQLRQLQQQAQQPDAQMQEEPPPESLTKSAHEWPAPESGPVDEAAIMAAVEDAGSAPRPESTAAQQSREALASGGLKTVAPQVTGQHLVSNVNKMLVDTLNLAPLAYGMATNTAPRSLYEIPFVKGATTSPIPEGAIPMADAVGTATQWGTGGLLSKAPIAATGLTDALMAGGAGLGDLIADETGELIGGFGGMGLAGLNALRGKLTPPPALTGEEKALKFIEKNMEDPNALREALARNLREGNKGTILDMTEDAGMTGVEAMLHTPKNLGKVQRATDEASRHAVEQMQAPFGAATSEQAVNTAQGLTKAKDEFITAARGMVDTETARAADEGLAQTRAAAEEAERNIAQTAEAANLAERQQVGATAGIQAQDRATESSKRAHGAIAEASDKFKREIEDPAWDAFREGGTVPAQEAKDAVLKVVGDLPELAAKKLKKADLDLFNEIESWKGDVPAEDVDHVRRLFSDHINMNEHFGQTERNWSALADAMDSALMKGSRADEYRAAVDATSAKHAKFSQRAMAKNMRQQADAPEVFLDKFNFTKGEGEATAKSVKATGEPEAIAALQDHFQFTNQNATVDKAFLDRHSGFLSEFPELQAKYQKLAAAGPQATEAQGLAKATAQQQGKVVAEQAAETSRISKQKEAGLAKTREQAAARRAEARSDVVGRYADDPKKTIDKLLSETSDTSLTELVKLRKTMKGKGAEDSLKASAKESLTSKVTTDNSGLPSITGSAMDAAKQSVKRLTESGILTADEAADVMKPIQRAADNQRRRRGTSALQHGDDVSGTGIDMKANALTMATMPVIPKGPHTLMITSSVKRMWKQLLRDDPYDQEAIDALGDFIADPKLYSDALDAKTAKEANEIMTKAYKASQAAKAGLTTARELTNEE